MLFRDGCHFVLYRDGCYFVGFFRDGYHFVFFVTGAISTRVMYMPFHTLMCFRVVIYDFLR